MSGRLVRALEAVVLVGALATIPLTLLGEENSPAKWVLTADWGKRPRITAPYGWTGSE